MRLGLFYIILSLSFAVLPAGAGDDYERFFSDGTMRIDYVHMGDSEVEQISIDHIYKQGAWAGSRTRLLDAFNRGRYAVKIFDIKRSALLFSRGFDSYFGEYKTTDAALDGIPRTFFETVLLPFPKDSIRFELYTRNKKQELVRIFRQDIDPNDVSVIKEKPSSDIQVLNAHKTGPPSERVDIAILGEGYTKELWEKFSTDVNRFIDIFFNKEPFKSNRNKFNIYGVLKPSSESGCDEPTKNIYKNTSLGATFNSLSSPRYLLTEDMFAMHDIAAAVPNEFIVIMVNSSRYGGGGIYNFFATCTADNEWTDFVFVHEFGHLFAGLADEYYSSSTAYNDFYPQGVEPMEPNITRLLDPSAVKWASLMDEDIPVPTPWDKAQYDSISASYSEARRKLTEQIAQKSKSDAPAYVIDSLKKEYDMLARWYAEKSNEILYENPYSKRVGVFEGAGYISEGMYRPMLDCIMFRIGDQNFCKVCQKAIQDIIDFHTQP